MSDRWQRIAALRPASKRALPEVSADETEMAAGGRIAELVGAERRRNRYGEYLLVRRWFADAEPTTLSPHALELMTPPARDKREFTLDPALTDPQQWLFLDTETTGLAGGTGTYAFLVGVAWWDGAGLQVEQLFMRDYDEEHALLEALRERLEERTTLVTFNGKTFDWPLLETRYRMTRKIKVTLPRAHLDLLQPARQLWRLRLESVRLTELERHILGWDRGPDIWSALIPQTYFDYLRGGPAEPLADVFRHNQSDLRGLVALACRMLAVLGGADATEAEPLDLYGMSRMYRRRGRLDEARTLYEQALEAGLPGAQARAARRELAAVAKRQRDFARAVGLWHEVVGEAADGRAVAMENPAELLEACEQLAIYYEHRARDPRRAAQMARKALVALRRAARHGMVNEHHAKAVRGRLEHRLERLRGKSTASLY